MPKGDLKPMDAYEQTIKDNAISYKVVFFQAATSARLTFTCDNFDEANDEAVKILSESNKIRSVMVYAANQYENHAMVGSMGRDLIWKPVIPSRF